VTGVTAFIVLRAAFIGHYDAVYLTHNNVLFALSVFDDTLTLCSTVTPVPASLVMSTADSLPQRIRRYKSRRTPAVADVLVTVALSDAEAANLAEQLAKRRRAKMPKRAPIPTERKDD
jgi:CBS-domain-containing membrane protein